MSSDNILEFSKKLKERQAKKQAQHESTNEVLSTPEVSKPSIEQLSSFLHVLSYLRQISPDGEGRVEFDDFAARIVLIANKLPNSEFEPQVNVALEIEGIFPFIWQEMEANGDDDIPVFEDVVSIAYNIIDQLEPDDEESI